VPAQIVWKDARGATRMMAVTTRDVSDIGVSVECAGGTPIPVFRLVHFQIDKEARMRRDLPAVLRKSACSLPCSASGPVPAATGAPAEYALRLLIEPAERAAAAPVEDDRRPEPHKGASASARAGRASGFGPRVRGTPSRSLRSASTLDVLCPAVSTRSRGAVGC
jgi:hypothetical protein